MGPSNTITFSIFRKASQLSGCVQFIVLPFPRFGICFVHVESQGTLSSSGESQQG